MSSEPTSKPPAPNHQEKPVPETVNPQDLVYAGGFVGDAREIVENPAVTPQMLNEPGDLRSDALEED
ncbi:hypothetical protein ACKFKG_16725 [Phormidesmis sp. 146-35]